MKSPHLGTLAVMTILAHGLALAAYGADLGAPAIHPPKPRHYRVHLLKAERRGKSFVELQALRAEHCHG